MCKVVYGVPMPAKLNRMRCHLQERLQASLKSQRSAEANVEALKTQSKVQAPVLLHHSCLTPLSAIAALYKYARMTLQIRATALATSVLK